MGGGIVKASVNSAFPIYWVEAAKDPKPSELAMGRVKSREGGMEAEPVGRSIPSDDLW